jgi:hypothetical protein
MSESMFGVSGVCHRCNQFSQVVFHDGAGYCPEHVPLQLTDEDFDLIFAKAGVSGPKRQPSFDKLFFSTAHHKRRPKRN